MNDWLKPESVIRFLFIFAYMCARLGHDSSKTQRAMVRRSGARDGAQRNGKEQESLCKTVI